ncbi:RNA polymerase sigma factor [Aeromicrobium fastidiosum]|uniref:RNA polymerase sigma factor n=1 Tax=Aeromicrobium fastidiosum TaxID=52699 RepID=UPI00165FF0F1|nr:sigma-70 family RNA polymerase sigma factor [Aeromicrobium fastidiosum]MBP2390516.1 RNA polymerase sigma-70 factor (ECF subfamily) [Aeromicrobium fastidiosum]
MTEEDFRNLYDALRDSVHLFALRRVGFEAAGDVVAETFEIAWKKRDEFPTDPTAWAGWVVGIAKNKVLQELQRRTRKHHDNRFVEDRQSSQPMLAHDDVAQTVVDSDAARLIYDQLTPAEQWLFDVAFIRELTPKDGAKILNISVSAFTSRVNRLRRRLGALELKGNVEPQHPLWSGGAPL